MTTPSHVFSFWHACRSGCWCSRGLALHERLDRWTVGFGLALGYTSVLATGVAWMLFYYALRRMPAGMVGLGTLATPVIGVIAAWLQLGERPAPLEATGMALIGTALAMLAWSPRSNAPSVGA